MLSSSSIMLQQPRRTGRHTQLLEKFRRKVRRTAPEYCERSYVEKRKVVHLLKLEDTRIIGNVIITLKSLGDQHVVNID